MKPKFTLVLAAALAFGACTDDPVSPEFRADDAPIPGITAMTRNVYVGTDVDAVIVALADGDPGNDQDALVAALTTLQATDFPARAYAIASEIARTRPHVVGLQEITYFNINLPGLATFELPFLPVLQMALADLGLDYEVGAEIKNIEVTLLGGAIQFADYDVVLYDAGRTTWQTAVTKNFEYNLGEVADGVVLKRGWIWGLATVGGTAYNVVSTHPEAGGEGIPDHPLSQLRYAQMAEIATALGDATPALIMGDLNDLAGSPMYQVLSGAGFADMWAELHPGEAGYTCCHQYDLMNSTTNFTKRIDYVLGRGLAHPGGGYDRAWIRILGADPSERVAGPYYPLWPSDHAGVAVRLFVPPANGLRP